MDDYVVGVLGGGQLGRMLVEAAHRLNINVAVLDGEGAPAKQNNLVTADRHVTGRPLDPTDVQKLSENCDVLTYEIEHVDTTALQKLEDKSPYLPGTQWRRIQPSWKTVRTIQDKFLQKQHLSSNGIATATSTEIKSSADLHTAGTLLGFPLMLKARTMAYDGRGNFPVKTTNDVDEAMKVLDGRPLYAERWANFKMELAVMVIKTQQEADAHTWEASTLAYPTAETIHEDSICKLVYVPARNVSKAIQRQAQSLARQAVATFEGTGVFGVEMFLMQDNSLVVNEIAPRPHNSGHYTIEACHMSQYEAQLKAILPKRASRIKLGATDLMVGAVVMLNILGGPQPDSHLLLADAAQDIPGAHVHLYGKGPGSPGRKMGHITLCGASMSAVEVKMHPLILLADSIRAHKTAVASSNIDIIATSTALLKTNPVPVASPRIAVVMGSDTDLETLKPGLKILDDIGVPYSVNITSAHRTPQYMLDFGREAAAKGYKVIIAAAGGAAHLPGMMSSETCLPLIGVPVKASSLDGLDSLLAIVQMPRGVPVATVGIGNSTNAAILAARIVGTSEPLVQEWVENHLKKMEKENLEKNANLSMQGWKTYQRVESWNK